MQKEIVNLLKKENKISDDTISEIKNIDLNDFSNIVKEDLTYLLKECYT